MTVNITTPEDDLAAGTAPVKEGNGVVGASTDAGPGSILGRIRKQAEEQLKEKVKDFPVGGEFGEMLQLRYKPLKPEEMDDFASRQSEAALSRAVQLTMDMMVRACIGVFTFNPDTGEKEELKFGGHPIGLDSRLMELLEIPQPHGPMVPREVVSLLFGHNGAAIAKHGDEVANWMVDPKAASESRSAEENSTP